MGDDSIVTAVSPINVGMIKYFDDPREQTFPINDYITLTLDRNIICARTSVCARREFESDEFWLNGDRCDSYMKMCLEEVKVKAAEQESVDEEFLERKVHICCENNFLPATGSAPFAAGIIALMTALCRLYKIRSPDLEDQCWFNSLDRTPSGGFLQRRDPNTHNSYRVATKLATGSHWPELRVLLLVVKIPLQQTSTENIRRITKMSNFLKVRTHFTLPRHVDKVRKAIRDRDFQTFAEIAMRDTNQYHAILQDTYPPRNYKTEISHKIVEMIDIYNQTSNEVRAGYTFETGPNPCIYFEEKNAAEIISLIKYVFPSKHDIFIKGVKFPEEINTEAFSNFALKPQKKNMIKYGIYTKVGDMSVEFDKKNHLLDHKGDIINHGRPVSLRYYLY